MNRTEHWKIQYEELKQHVAEHGHYPPRHTQAYNWIRHQTKLRNKGELEDWKVNLLVTLDSMRTHEHTGGRRKKEKNG